MPVGRMLARVAAGVVGTALAPRPGGVSVSADAHAGSRDELAPA